MDRIRKLDIEKREKLAQRYEALIDKIGFEENVPMKSRDIVKKINYTDRHFREIVEDILHLYRTGYMDRLIIGTNKGYILTDNQEMLRKKVENSQRQFKAMAYNCYNLKKALEKQDLTLEAFFKECQKEFSDENKNH